MLSVCGCIVFSLVGVRGGSSCWARGSHCSGLGTQASVVVAYGLSNGSSWALEYRFHSCGTWALLLHGMWNLPRPGIETMSSALAGRFSTRDTREGPIKSILYLSFQLCIWCCINQSYPRKQNQHIVYIERESERKTKREWKRDKDLITTFRRKSNNPQVSYLWMEA